MLRQGTKQSVPSQYRSRRALILYASKQPAGIMSDESDESDDVSPPMAEPLLYEILRTIETAKEMPDDCPMHLQDFFAQVSAREPHAITTELLANGCSTPPACLVLRPSRTLDTAGSWACTACTYTPQHAALGKMLRSRARPVLHALISSTSGSHCSKFDALTASPIRPLAGLPSRTWQKGLHRHQGVAC